MKSRTKLALAALAVSLNCVSALAVEVGQPAPDVSLPGAKGQVNLADAKGGVTYVDFWASWCGPCKQSFPWMNEMQSRYGSKGLRIIGVNLDKKREDADKFLAEVKADFNIAFDPSADTAKRYGVKGMPSSYLVGPDGKILMVHSGFREDERKELEQRIATALGAK